MRQQGHKFRFLFSISILLLCFCIAFYFAVVPITTNIGSQSGGAVSEHFPHTRSKIVSDELSERHLKTLNCEAVKEGEGLGNIPNIAYWFDIPLDDAVRSEYEDLDPNPKYASVGIGIANLGFNNQRLVWESAVVFAAATGRTLVLPPDGFYFDPETFYPTNELRKVVNVITAKEFIEKEAITNQLGIMPGEEVYADMHRTAIEKYFEDVARQYPGGVPDFKLGKEVIVLPFKPGEEVIITDSRRKDQDDFNNWLDGRHIQPYTSEWSEAKFIYLKDVRKQRLLIPFYCLLRHSVNDKDMYFKRLVRDRLHVHDKFFCKAGQIIAMLREESTTGCFNTMHVRRGDFQYKEQRNRTGMELFLITANDFPDNSVLFIATDEMNTSFFKPFQEHYNVKFLKDYEERAGLSEIPTKAWGQLDAIIASHGDIFYGT